MKPYRIHALFTGIFFLISDITSVAALVLYQPLLKHVGFITAAGANQAQILLGVFLELLLAVSVAGTALALYPLLKRANQSLALSYVIGRTAEGLIITIGFISLLAALTLRHDFLSTPGDPLTYQAIGKTLVALHDWTFLIGPNIILAVNATILGYVLYTSRVVPRAIALLALIDGPILFISGIAIMFGAYSQSSAFAGLLALPMFIFEVSFAVRLIARGFEPKAVAALGAE